MIYTRNNDALIAEISSSEFSLLSPSYWQNMMNAYSIYFQSVIETPFALPVDRLYGFCEQPDYYCIQTYYDKFSYFADKDHTAVWYDDNGNTIEMFVEVASPSLVFMPIPFGYNKMMYQNGKEVIVKNNCQPLTGKKVALVFWDLYGQLQSVALQLGESNYSTAVDTDYRLANNGVVYYALLHPTDIYTIGKDYVTEDLYDFYKGLCSNGAVMLMSKENNILQNKPASLSQASLTTNVYGKNGFLSGQLELLIGDSNAVIL